MFDSNVLHIAEFMTVAKSLPHLWQKVRKLLIPKLFLSYSCISTKKLADLVADRCSLSRGDVFASVCEIGGMILELLKDGYSVELDGLGDFYLSAGSEGFEDPKKCTPHRVKARRVCFRMAPCVRKSMKFVKFERNPW